MVLWAGLRARLHSLRAWLGVKAVRNAVRLADGQARALGKVDVEACGALVGEVEVWGRDVRDDRRVFVESPADEFGACRRVARQGIRVVGLPVSQRELVEPEAGCAARRSAAGSQ